MLGPAIEERSVVASHLDPLQMPRENRMLDPFPGVDFLCGFGVGVGIPGFGGARHSVFNGKLGEELPSEARVHQEKHFLYLSASISILPPQHAPSQWPASGPPSSSSFG